MKDKAATGWMKLLLKWSLMPRKLLEPDIHDEWTVRGGQWWSEEYSVSKNYSYVYGCKYGLSHHGTGNAGAQTFDTLLNCMKNTVINMHNQKKFNLKLEIKIVFFCNKIFSLHGGLMLFIILCTDRNIHVFWKSFYFTQYYFFPD